MPGTWISGAAFCGELVPPDRQCPRTYCCVFRNDSVVLRNGATTASTLAPNLPLGDPGSVAGQGVSPP